VGVAKVPMAGGGSKVRPGVCVGEPGLRVGVAKVPMAGGGSKVRPGVCVGEP
jgi:hypothetical protein